MEEKKYKVLVIDDEAAIVDLISEILNTNANLEVEGAFGGLGALRKLEKVKYDLILTDFRMPDISGGELVKRLREGDGVNKDCAILFVTANPEQTKEFIESYEDILILTKPITIRNLAEKVVQTILNN